MARKNIFMEICPQKVWLETSCSLRMTFLSGIPFEKGSLIFDMGSSALQTAQRALVAFLRALVVVYQLDANLSRNSPHSSVLEVCDRLAPVLRPADAAELRPLREAWEKLRERGPKPGRRKLAEASQPSSSSAPTGDSGFRVNTSAVLLTYPVGPPTVRSKDFTKDLEGPVVEGALALASQNSGPSLGWAYLQPRLGLQTWTHAEGRKVKAFLALRPSDLAAPPLPLSLQKVGAVQ